MAINVKLSKFYGASCPKCANSTSSRSATGSRCHSCRLVFSKGFVTNIMSVAGVTNSKSLDGHAGELHNSGRSRSEASARAIDDDFTDSEDEAENLKVFER
jgi:ribosomal protein S27E